MKQEIVLGGILVVNGIEGISRLTGISTTFLGLTIAAMATSLPELFTTFFSQKGHQEKIVIGNIIGSNIYNLLFIGGIVMLFPGEVVISRREWFWLAIATSMFVILLRFYSGRQPPRWMAMVLWTFLCLYFFSLRIL